MGSEHMADGEDLQRDSVFWLLWNRSVENEISYFVLESFSWQQVALQNKYELIKI
jgi:hypothetical protein